MSLVSPPRTLSDGYACVELFIRHPRCAQKFTGSVMLSFGKDTDWRSRRSTLKRFLTAIGTRACTSSRYRVSHDHQLVGSYLITKRRGHCRWKPSLVVRITILRNHNKTLPNYYMGGHPAGPPKWMGSDGGDSERPISILRASWWPELPLYCPCVGREDSQGVRLGRNEEGPNDQPHMWPFELQPFQM